MGATTKPNFVISYNLKEGTEDNWNCEVETAFRSHLGPWSSAW
jgi:hypothetical protein